MNEMIERVARAMCEKAGTDWSDTSGDEYAPALISRPFWFQQARVAILAMDQPTQSMIDAVDLSVPTEGEILGIWSAMIDAAAQ